MEDNIQVDKLFLQKFAEFTKVVLSELKHLRGQLSEQMAKEASYDEQQETYYNSVVKIANVLHESDYDFVIGGDRKKFIKKASANPLLIAEAFGKVCEASDVTLIGRPARVAARSKIASFDPVYARAFGLGGNHETLVDLED
jgi:hypothetical protein